MWRALLGCTLLGATTALASGVEKAAPLVPVKAGSPITLDGKADEPFWKAAEASDTARITQWRMMNETGDPAPGKRQLLAAYDAENLYLFYEAAIDEEAGLMSVPATPEEGDCIRVEIHQVAMGIDCENNRLQLLLPYLIPLRSAVDHGDKTWRAEIAIPWEHADGLPGKGVPVPFNVVIHDSVIGSVTWAPVRHPRDLKKLGTLQLPETP